MAPTIFLNPDEPIIKYNAYRPNEKVPSQIQPSQIIDNGRHEKEEEKDGLSEQITFHTGDKVVIKQMDIRLMKKLQENHGEWHPKIELEMGQHGIVTGVSRVGDLNIVTRNLFQWTFNQECIERSATHTFSQGAKARFKKDLSTDDMKRMQELSGLWLPIMEDMKGQLCIVQGTHPLKVNVTMLMNGFMFEVNPDLLEKVDQSEQEETHQRSFRKGDRVKIVKRINKDEFRKYGISFDADVLKTKVKMGTVKHVNKGYDILVQIDDATKPGSLMYRYPPSILNLEKESDEIYDEPILQEMQLYFEGILFKLAPSPSKTEERQRLAIKMVQSAQHLRYVGQEMKRLAEEAQEQAEHPKMNKNDQQQHPVDFGIGDQVCVKHLDPKEMKKKQEQHGGWSPLMIFAIGKNGFVEQVLPSGDLHVSIDNQPFQSWYFNPDCVTLVEKFEPHGFNVGQKVRFRDLPTKEMIKLQEQYGGWVPLMADMKNKMCVIRKSNERQLGVETMDGYFWSVNPKLLEVVGEDIHEEQYDRGFKKGDTVEIRDIPKDEMKRWYKHHGIAFVNDRIFKAQKHKGLVVDVKRGRIVLVYVNIEGGKVIACCRPILKLVPESDDTDFAGLANQEIVSMSLDADGQVQATFSIVRLTPENLLMATATGNTQVAKDILEKHPQWVDTISEDGQYTALTNACAAGHLNIVKLLVNAGARLDMDTIDGNTAVIVAALRNKTEILKYLLDKGATLDVTNINGVNALHAAVAANSTDCVVLLLERCSKKEFNKESHQGMTPTYIAIMNKEEPIWRMMMDSKHFNPAVQNKDGFTALHAAAFSGNEIAAQIILDKHPEGINDQTMGDKWTPLHLAAFNKHASVVKLLLDQKNCDKNPRTEYEETPLLLAECHKEIVGLLLESGADPSIANKDLETCLHQVYKLRERDIELHAFLKDMPDGFPLVEVPDEPNSKYYIDVGKLLIHKGAHVDAKDKLRKTPLDYIRDDTVKADILAEVDADNCLKANLKDFEDRLESLSGDDRLKQVYQTSTFAARYFDCMGGYLEIPKADVRMHIPPGAVTNPTQLQLIYINLDQVNHDVKGSLAPVIQFGPPGTRFGKKITLSYPHCAAKESDWKFQTLISEDADVKWKDVYNEEGVESRIKNGRVIVETVHFTRFTTKGEPATEETQKYIRVGAFGKDYTKGTSTYQFRVRTWKDTPASREVVRKKECYLNSKPIDADRRLLVRNTNKDVSVTVNTDTVRKGWKLRHEESQHLIFSDVWDNAHPSCTFDLDTIEECADSTQRTHSTERVHSLVKANQLESPANEYVTISISPYTIPEEGQTASGNTSYQSLKVVLYGEMPKGFENMPPDLYLELCGILTTEDDVHGDWRKIISEMGLGDMTTINNIKRLKSCPANFALETYLNLCKSKGSNNPVRDLSEVFEKLQLHSAKQHLQNWKEVNNNANESANGASQLNRQPTDPQSPERSNILLQVTVDYNKCKKRKSTAYQQTVNSVVALVNERDGGIVRLHNGTGHSDIMYDLFDRNLDSQLYDDYKLSIRTHYEIKGMKKHTYRDLQVKCNDIGKKIHKCTHAYHKTRKSAPSVISTTVLCQIAKQGAQPVDPNKPIQLREDQFFQDICIGEETECMEFKQCTDGDDLIDKIFDHMKEYISALGNTYGGIIYFGVDDCGIVHGHEQIYIGHESKFLERFKGGKLKEMIWLQKGRKLTSKQTLEYWDVRVISTSTPNNHPLGAKQAEKGNAGQGLHKKNKACTDVEEQESGSTSIHNAGGMSHEGIETSSTAQDIATASSDIPKESPTCNKATKCDSQGKTTGKAAGTAHNLTTKVVVEVMVERLTNGIIFTSLPECPKYDKDTKKARMMTETEWMEEVMPTLFN